MTLYIILALILLVAAYFIISRSKTSTLGTPAVQPVNFNVLLNDNISYYTRLSSEEKLRFSAAVQKFLAEVTIEGVGTEVSDADRIMIGASAVIPIFGFPGWEYKNLTNIILYPDAFNNDFQFEGGTRDMAGLVGGGFMNGQMLLSRTALLKGFSKNNGKENAAVHEFVHLLDSADGATDGIPDALADYEYAKPWLHMMHQEMHKIQEGHSDINPYAITNDAEFFAVAAEYFFEKPDQLKDKHPQVYGQLSSFFRQDPAQQSTSS